MNKKERIAFITETLDHLFPNPPIPLNHTNAYTFLIAVLLSAQCTDARVNIVTEDLFKKYITAEDFAKADLKELEQEIHSTGFYHNKAKNIIASSKIITEKYNGRIPDTMEELTALPGVGRKTANVIASVIYDKPVIAVDTHVFRVSRRIGLSEGTTVEAVERDLTAGFAPEMLPAMIVGKLVGGVSAVTVAMWLTKRD